MSQIYCRLIWLALLCCELLILKPRAAVAADVLQPIPHFFNLPKDKSWGACSAVAVNSKGEIIVFHRGVDPLMVFAADGQFLRAWGNDLIGSAHGLRVDQDDNIWTTDIGGHRVMKFDPTGKLLLSLGTGRAGSELDQFNKPTDIAFGPQGEFFVTDGYGNTRVMKFEATGKLISSWGKPGKADGQFNLPHAIVIDRQKRLIVGDRENNRVQLFDQDGKWLATWPGFAPYGLAQDRDGRLYVADARAQQILRLKPNGEVDQRWGQKGTGPGEFDLPHMLTFDAAGDLYVAEVNGRRVQKFAVKPVTTAARRSVEDGLKLLSQSSRNYPKHRKCFACHHQTFPVIALREAQKAGLTTDVSLAREIGDFTAQYFRGRMELMREGNGVPGRGLMAAYGIVTLVVAQQVDEARPDRPADAKPFLDRELTQAFIDYLIKSQKPDGRWPLAVVRPPMEESEVAAATLARLALLSLSRDVDDTTQQAIDGATARAKQWLEQAPLELTEDLAMRLLGMMLDGSSRESRQPIMAQLVARQRADGGWGQTREMESDAYATGQALLTLLSEDRLTYGPAADRAVSFLLRTQRSDGSWFVKSRAKPIQEFFDNGDPHGTDQFISITATGWATIGLARWLQPE